MSVLRPRNRSVYFRVSEEEFQKLSSLCLSEGARSLSEMARLAIQQKLADAESQPDRVSERLDQLSVLLWQIQNELSRLNRLLQSQSFEASPRSKSPELS